LTVSDRFRPFSVFKVIPGVPFAKNGQNLGENQEISEFVDFRQKINNF